MKIRIGETIKALRRRDGRTQENLAQALGITFQAVSRWEAGDTYPDMELVPAIANYFGVTVDELFGVAGEREARIDATVAEIREMDRANNGEDVCIAETLLRARGAMAEYPASPKVMHCLADVLYNAGFARHGEHHAVDADGYDVLDTARHAAYAEWQEAIKLYEKLAETLHESDARTDALRKLITLYAEVGEREKGIALAQQFHPLAHCRELTLAYALDGKERADCISQAVLALVARAAEQTVQAYISRRFAFSAAEAVTVIENAIAMYALVCPDGEYGLYHYQLRNLYLYLSTHRWRAGDRDGAFAALDQAYACAVKFVSYSGDRESAFRTPLLAGVKINPDGCDSLCGTAELPSCWPWWCVPGYKDVAREMQSDPRWDAWVERCKNG